MSREDQIKLLDDEYKALVAITGKIKQQRGYLQVDSPAPQPRPTAALPTHTPREPQRGASGSSCTAACPPCADAFAMPSNEALVD